MPFSSKITAAPTKRGLRLSLLHHTLIGRMSAAQGKHGFSAIPKMRTDKGVAAFAYRARHFSAHRSAQRMSAVQGRHVNLQQQLALRKANVLRTGGMDAHAIIGGKTVLPAMIHNGTNAAGEA